MKLFVLYKEFCFWSRTKFVLKNLPNINLCSCNAHLNNYGKQNIYSITLFWFSLSLSLSHSLSLFLILFFLSLSISWQRIFNNLGVNWKVLSCRKPCFFYFYKKLISSFRCRLLRLTHSGPLVIPINCLIKSQCTQQCLRFQPCWFQTTSWNFRKRIKRIPVL